MEWLICFMSWFYVILTPFNKVEESFNIQATHDILYHGVNLEQYDHLEFPGVVPRTFVGPLLLSSIAWPFIFIVRIFGLSKLYSQYIVRIILATLVFLAWQKLRTAIKKQFGFFVTLWFTIITLTQFHFLYYMSRLLPNSFALIFALLAVSYWIEEKHKRMIWTCGLCVVIFRIELCLLLGPMILYDLYEKRLGIFSLAKELVLAGVVCLLTTCIVDSLFWGRLLWPEGEVFWFNTYMNQSSQWGVYPFFWYWYSALPRALGFTFVLAPIGVAVDSRIRVLTAPAFLFVSLYSFLPHKELRFILYALPFFNIAAARACHYFWCNRNKSSRHQLLALGSCLHLLGNICLTVLLASVSSCNYPGGEAMQLLHETVDSSEFVNVHIGNLAAQTGASRFTQLHDDWMYNKTEHLKAGSKDMLQFSHLLVQAKSKYAYNLKHYTDTHDILGSVESFSHLHYNYNSFPPIKIRVKPSIFLLRVRYTSIDQYASQNQFDTEDFSSKDELPVGLKSEGFTSPDNQRIAQASQDTSQKQT